MLRARLRPSLPLAFASLLSAGACSPSVESFEIGAGEPGQRLDATASVKKNAASIQSVVVASAPAGSDAFGPEQAMANTAGGVWAGQTLPHVAGDYQARLSVSYKRLFQSAVHVLTRTTEYSLAWPAGTFAFDAPTTGVDGWTFQGIFSGADGTDVTQCDPLPSQLFTRSGTGWPDGPSTGPSAANGSLRVLLTDVCFPSSPLPGAPLWQFNLRSPDLEGVAEWQGISGVSFRMISIGPVVQAQATVIYADESGADAFASPTEGGALDFAEVDGSWVTVARSGYVPAGRPIRGVLIRVYGEQGAVSTGEPGTLLVDVVQPVS